MFSILFLSEKSALFSVPHENLEKWQQGADSLVPSKNSQINMNN